VCNFNRKGYVAFERFLRDCICIVCLLLLCCRSPQGAIAGSMVPRARPKGRALVRAQWCCPSSKGGNDPAAWHSARGVPQTGFASGSFPQISISRSITNTRLWAIGTRRNEHAKARPFPASDSPRRASRYDPLAGAASVACSTRPRSHNPTPCPIIRSAALFMVAAAARRQGASP